MFVNVTMIIKELNVKRGRVTTYTTTIQMYVQTMVTVHHQTFVSVKQDTQTLLNTFVRIMNVIILLIMILNMYVPATVTVLNTTIVLV